MHVVLKTLRKVNIQSIFKLSSCLCTRSKRRFFEMAANGATAEQTEEKEGEEQIVNIETVVAADNKGIDYDKLISKLRSSLACLTSGVLVDWVLFYTVYVFERHI